MDEERERYGLAINEHIIREGIVKCVRYDTASGTGWPLTAFSSTPSNPAKPCYDTASGTGWPLTLDIIQTHKFLA